MSEFLRAPFPWFGGKRRVASLVWERFGNVPNYVEPFAGSLAVLLGRPHAPKTETVNDRDCYLANFWRALRADPDDVARFADWPVNEAEIEARHHWLVAQVDFRERMMRDPEFFDAKVAGWWVYGLCGWIGSGWCQAATAAPGHRRPRCASETEEEVALGDGGRGVHRKLPHLGSGRGVHRKLPHLGDGGRGVHRQLPHLGDGEKFEALSTYFSQLAERLRGVRVACGDWERVMGDSVTWRHGTTAIFLDPPYDDGAIDYSAGGRGISAEVAEWCREHGDDKRLRIALCGYEGDHAMPESWSVVAWKAHGGYGSQRESADNENATRERIWFSPGCEKVEERQLSIDAILARSA